MEDFGRIKLNTLNYDAGAQRIEFSFQGSQGEQTTSLSGRVSLVMPAEGDTRQISKDAVRQVLLEALEAL